VEEDTYQCLSVHKSGLLIVEIPMILSQSSIAVSECVSMELSHYEYAYSHTVLG